MVGDSEVDLATAKAARVKAVLVSFGYAAQPLEALAPDAVIDHFDELAPHAEALLRGGPN
jgi:phosphoglycolate phosphatase